VLIGLCGKAGSGKSTAAEIICEKFGFDRLSFATALREEIYVCWLTGDWTEGSWPPDLDPALKDREVAKIAGVAELADMFRKPTPGWLRRLLQWYGTEFRRARDEDYWIKKLEERIWVSGPERNYVIDDVRYPNEAEFVTGNGCLILLERTGDCGKEYRLSGEAEKHSSEQVDFLRPYVRAVIKAQDLTELEREIVRLVPELVREFAWRRRTLGDPRPSPVHASKY